jgi:cell division septation protein DedD
MSRVFDVLTAAVCEKNDLAKRELRGSATEDDLIAGFHPVLRSQSASTAGALPLGRLSTKETHEPTISDCQEIAAHEDQWNLESRPDLHRFKVVPVAALLAVVFSIMGYMGMPTDNANRKQVNSMNTSANEQQSVPVAQTPEDAKTRATKREFSNTAGDQDSQVAAKVDSSARLLLTKDPNKPWSVQVSAITSKEVAEKLMQNLKSEGYDVYVVRANVQGQTYHRVRIGSFRTREEAEPTRQSLTHHDAFRDAYLAAD